MKLQSCMLTAFVFAVLTTTVPASENPAEKTLMFDVFLDGRKIGFHRFEIDGPKSRREMGRRLP